MRFPHFITVTTEAHNNQTNLGLILFIVTQDSFRLADFLFYFIYLFIYLFIFIVVDFVIH